MAVAQLAEEVGVSLGPMQLVEVDPVRLQSLQAGIQGLGDVTAVYFQLAVADMSDPVSGAGDLAGYDPVRAAAAGLEIVADVAFGGRVGFRAGRHRIHFGGVDEVHARSLGPIELGEGL